MITASFTTWNVQNTTVLLRTDFNVPCHDETIVNDARLIASLPTLNHLIQKNAHVLIISHRGNPRGFDQTVSLEPVAQWLRARKFTVELIQDIDTYLSKIHQPKSGTITLLENIRYIPGEKAQDQNFARTLAAQATFFINDAWGTMHRGDTSVALVPGLFDASHRSIGLLVQQEITKLNLFLEQWRTPAALIMGGGKADDKMKYITALAPRLSYIFALPQLSTLLHTTPAVFKNKCIFPLEEAAKAQEILKTTHTRIYNGVVPDSSYATAPELQIITNLLISADVQGAQTLIIGGDTVAAYQRLVPQNKPHVIFSTGGGATLAYLAGQKLPGLVPFL